MTKCLIPVHEKNIVEMVRDIDVMSRDEVKMLIADSTESNRLSIHFGKGGAMLRPVMSNEWAVYALHRSRGAGNT